MNDLKYLLKLRQNPKHSRMCGLGEKVDRRPIDPPPIIEMDILTPADLANKQNRYYFMYASILPLDSEKELHLLRDGKTRSTTGSIVSSLYQLKDTEGKDGAFFIFPDLSVRMEGTFRLKFSMYEIIDNQLTYCASIISDPYSILPTHLGVYSAKKFPGMEGKLVFDWRIDASFKSVRRAGSQNKDSQGSAGPRVLFEITHRNEKLKKKTSNADIGEVNSMEMGERKRKRGSEEDASLDLNPNLEKTDSYDHESTNTPPIPDLNMDYHSPKIDAPRHDPYSRPKGPKVPSSAHVRSDSFERRGPLPSPYPAYPPYTYYDPRYRNPSAEPPYMQYALPPIHPPMYIRPPPKDRSDQEPGKEGYPQHPSFYPPYYGKDAPLRPPPLVPPPVPGAPGPSSPYDYNARRAPMYHPMYHLPYGYMYPPPYPIYPPPAFQRFTETPTEGIFKLTVDDDPREEESTSSGGGVSS